MKVKKTLNSDNVKKIITAKSVRNAAKIIKSSKRGTFSPTKKAIIKILNPETSDSATSELKVHESITIPLTDPFHDV